MDANDRLLFPMVIVLNLALGICLGSPLNLAAAFAWGLMLAWCVRGEMARQQHLRFRNALERWGD